MGFSFLVVISVILWGASQGFYSKKVVLSPKKPATATAKDACEEYKLELDKCNGKVFEKSLELDKMTAKVAELTRDVNDLMNSINMLTTKLQAAELANARLSVSLKNALEDLDKKSRQLQECNAKLLAKQIVSERCHMTPETANLIR
jgi:chromosome segregation ATPase